MVPFELDNYGISVTTYGRDDMDIFTTTLVVPTGTKELYANSEGWNNFSEIVEMDDPCTFDKVIEGVRYLGVGETAEIYNCYFWDTPQHLIIPDKVTCNGRDFKVTRIASGGLEGSQVTKSDNHLKYVTLNESLMDVYYSSIISTSTDTYYALNEMPVRDWRPYTFGIPKVSVYNPYLYENLVMPNVEDYGFLPVTFYVPGRFPIDKDGFREMWVYEVDKTNGIVKIRPKISDLVIDAVAIDGEVISMENGLYHFKVNAGMAPDVKITYTLHNRQSMTTHYDVAFNTELPDTDLTKDSEVLVESLTIDPSVFTGPEGTMFKINATIFPEDATDKTLEYESSDTSIASVDKDGYVRVNRTGSCTIMVSTTDGSNLSAECTIIAISGVDAVFTDDAVTDVYNVNGILVKEGCSKEQLKQLPPAIYILRNGNSIVKAVVR